MSWDCYYSDRNCTRP